MSTPSRPNILWLSIEDTSPRFGCYGDTVARTPHLDRLASQGCRYTHAFTTAGVCAPSRSSIITGMYATSIGAHQMRTTTRNRPNEAMPPPYETVPPPYVKAFPEYLRAAGYYTTNNAKTDYQFASPPTAWDGCHNKAHWRDRRRHDQPFFAVFNPTMTHESCMFSPPEKTITDPAAVAIPPWIPDTPETRKALARWYDCMEQADARIGELLAELEADGLAENTIVFVWSDHGCGLPRGKRWLYDSGIHSPLIVRWPGGLKPGTVSSELVSLIDLAPTVLSLTGTPVPMHLQGTSFLGPNQGAPRRYAYAARDRFDESYDMVRACRDQRYKYIRNFQPELPRMLWLPYRNHHAAVRALWDGYLAGTLNETQAALFAPGRAPEELYDTKTDPWEIHNLAADPGYYSDLTRMREALDEWRDEVGDLGDIPETQMVHRWWPDGVQPTTAAPTCAAFVHGEMRNATLEPAADSGDAGAAPAALGLPAALSLQTPTQGASIAWTLDAGEEPYWELYTGPIRLSAGSHTLRTRANRIGFKPSTTATYNIVASD